MFSGIPLFPEQASTLAPRVDNLYLFIVAVTAFFALLVTVVVIVFAVKYRTDDPLKVGARIHGSIPLELVWSIIPFIISVVIFGWAADVFFDAMAPRPRLIVTASTPSAIAPLGPAMAGGGGGGHSGDSCPFNEKAHTASP